MERLLKRTAGFTFILLVPFTLLAQQSVEFQRSAVGQMLSKNQIVEFLGSPAFKMAIIVISIVTLAIWAFYFLSMVRMNQEERTNKKPVLGPLSSFPAELFARGSFGTHHVGAALPRIVPAEKKEEEPENARAKNHDQNQRG